MFNGITIEKLLLLGVIAALIIGPERLPRYAEGLARMTHRVRDFLSSTKTRVKDEMGEDFDDVDWRSLDPRQYDPRRIIREALLDDAPIATGAAVATSTAPAAPTKKAPIALAPGEVPPFDSEAT
ncbi:Sec-independent protein translocase TatB [Microbacterium fluvii]|uniref:Sec-independent protein translocase TatB n=1 Tax=Microbacterium fluvii TaxID=415215 RepID=A0ABW2HBB6_9MICO|nr:Sec-independent protein translocase TatB [Microbacterium fluvii]MCU4672251.1 Sec-independent protein translocase TatB [Microbacterium fluvii]